jgi:hypothetical protein
LLFYFHEKRNPKRSRRAARWPPHTSRHTALTVTTQHKVNGIRRLKLGHSRQGQVEGWIGDPAR